MNELKDGRQGRGPGGRRAGPRGKRAGAARSLPAGAAKAHVTVRATVLATVLTAVVAAVVAGCAPLYLPPAPAALPDVTSPRVARGYPQVVRVGGDSDSSDNSDNRDDRDNRGDSSDSSDSDKSGVNVNGGNAVAVSLELCLLVADMDEPGWLAVQWWSPAAKEVASEALWLDPNAGLAPESYVGPSAGPGVEEDLPGTGSRTVLASGAAPERAVTDCAERHAAAAGDGAAVGALVALFVTPADVVVGPGEWRAIVSLEGALLRQFTFVVDP